MKNFYLLILLLLCSASPLFSQNSGIIDTSQVLDTLGLKIINGKVLVRDTSAIFNPTTYEEQVKVISRWVPLDQYLAEKETHNIPPEANFIVLDTVTTFNPQTFEETVIITRKHLTPEEYRIWQTQKIKKE